VNTEPIWLFGAGGHARVLLDALRACGGYSPVGVLDDDPRRHGEEVAGVPVVGPITATMLRRFDVRLALIAIGDNRIRAAIAHRFEGVVSWPTVVHPRAHLASDVRLGAGTVVLAGVVVGTGARVGRHAILNTSCSVDHDNQLGDFVHIAPGAHLGGGVRIGEGTLVGIGATVLNDLEIGRWTTLGGGAVATTVVPDDVVAVGVPARWLVATGTNDR
jgi:sugar O-acyltransferase (sialic acid O-acetyltransferase NeuD family)